MKMFTLLMLIYSFSTWAKFDPAKEFKKNCAVCHSIGKGDKLGPNKKTILGPDLASIGDLELAWVTKWMKYPTGMIEGDEEEAGYEKADAYAKKLYKAYKPQMMAEQSLNDEQIKSIYTWIKSQKKKAKGKVVDLHKKLKKLKKKSKKKKNKAKKK